MGIPGHRRRPSEEDGFTLIEVVLSIFLLAVGLLATIGSFNSSEHLSVTTQREQAATTLAEQTLEQMRALPYATLGLTSLPTHSADGNLGGDTSGNPTNPNYWVSGTNLLIPQSYSLESSPTLSGVAAGGEALVQNAGGVAPETDTVTTGAFTASVYRYVSYIDDHCLVTANLSLALGGSKGVGVDLCAGTRDAKRVTVAVVLNGAGNGVKKPVWLSTTVNDPQADLNAS